MNKTSSVVSFISGLGGAGVAYAILSRDTKVCESVTPVKAPNSNVLNPSVRISNNRDKKFEIAIKKSQEMANIFRDEIGTPGLVIGVSVDGKTIWEEGFGHANLETRTPCHVNTVMRIASISKPITMTLLAKLCENKLVDLDKSVHDYVPYFPKKEVDGEEVDITVRQLASHTSGVRHYTKKGEVKEKRGRDSGKEFYLKEKIDSVEKSVDLFKNDELLFKPGTSFEYTTHGYTLLSAVIETASKKSFIQNIQEFFKLLNLENTHLDKIETIIHGRASYYDKNKSGRIVNAQLTDNSYKWAGGGFVSTVGDLLKFGNIMLYSYQQADTDKPGYLNRQTVSEMWTPVGNGTVKLGKNAGQVSLRFSKMNIKFKVPLTVFFHSSYGLGWAVVPKQDNFGGVAETQFHVGHSGGAVGASSVLLIFPSKYEKKKEKLELPSGIVVAILANLENVSCASLGQKIANEFYKSYNNPEP
ncbi:hypothetical protein RUM43_007578 [Polyplax serrata]|uniref:Beta-lactamase-related domain-containing protein n=1 Tax=Polyplax serrata TaxID=468196 RepID=A0AAN8PMT6_POLSC